MSDVRPNPWTPRRCGGDEVGWPRFAVFVALSVLMTACPKEPKPSLPPLRAPNSSGADAPSAATSSPELKGPSPTPPSVTSSPALDALQKPSRRSAIVDRANRPSNTAQPRTEPVRLSGIAPQRYPARRTLSPMTPGVAANIHAIAGRNVGLSEDVFIKVGASGSATPHLLGCLATRDVVLGDFKALSGTLEAFRRGPRKPLERKSLAARPGKTARWALTPTAQGTSPLAQEVAEMAGRFALVHYGTNDMHMATRFVDALHPFARHLTTIVDRLAAQGVVPALGTLSPRLDRPDADHWVPVYNQVVRAVAQARAVPLLDMHAAMLALPNLGRAADALHANMLVDGGRARPCVFTERGLRYAYNVRNYLSLRLLDQLRRIARRESYDAEEGDPALPGDGSPKTPWRIDGLPFADLRDIRRSPHLEHRSASCQAGNPPARTGPEFVYEIELKEPTRLRVVAVNLTGTDVDVYLLRADGRECLRYAGQEIAGRFVPGTYRIVVDTRLSGELPRWGEYVLVAVPCSRADKGCEAPAF